MKGAVRNFNLKLSIKNKYREQIMKKMFSQKSLTSKINDLITSLGSLGGAVG